MPTARKKTLMQCTLSFSALQTSGQQLRKNFVEFPGFLHLNNKTPPEHGTGYVKQKAKKDENTDQ